jgi:hypothetical protein
MTRPFRLRLGSALLAALYLALPGGAWGIRPCAHHDDLGAAEERTRVHAAVAQGAVTAHDAAHGGHAGHGETEAEPGAGDNHDVCSCLGVCATGSASAAPAAADVRVALPTIEPTGVRTASTAPFVARPPYFLPHQNGPPSGSR